MDLKGTEIRNLIKLCDPFDKSNSEPNNQLNINIPHYQRPYLWENKHIKMLLEDFYQHYNEYDRNKYKKYFAGSIVSVRTNPGDRVNLIDGQQRITTLFLIGYLQFIIAREISKVMITQNLSTQINDYVEKTANIYRSIIKNDNSLNEKVENIKELGVRIDDPDSEDKEKIIDDRINAFREAFCLPNVGYDDKNNYGNWFVKKTNDLFGDNKLNLSYSRQSLNNKLKRALERVFLMLDSQLGPKLKIHEDKIWENDEAVKKYTEVIKIVFDDVESRLKGDTKYDTAKSYKKAEKIKEKLDALIDNTSFCVIETGNTSDAYKLFEVLNDRALALDDLDLLKNLYYKEYCENTDDDDEKVDQNIEELENLWSDMVFTSRDWTKDIISYAGTAYISGKSSQLNKNENKRNIIEEYLKNKYSGGKYTFSKIKRDFIEYHKVRLIVDTYNLKSRYAPELIIIDAKNDYSITYKTLHLITTLRQYGVFAGLSNIVLKTFEDSFDGEDGLDYKDNFIKFLNDIKKVTSHSNDKYKNMHKIAQKLWQTVVLSEDFTKAKEVSDDIINKISRNKNEYANLAIPGAKDTDLLNDFGNWVKSWRYGKSSDIKIRILLARAITFRRDNNKLVKAPIGHGIEEGAIFQLDHLEPDKVDEDWKDFYFRNNTDEAIASNCLNQIGNFLLLEKKNNIQKSNVPIDHADAYYKKTGLDVNHWLREDIEKFLDKYSEKKPAAAKTMRIPKKEFFEKRTEWLIERFKEIIAYDIIS